MGAACAVVLAALAVSTAFADRGHARISLATGSAPPGAPVGGSGSGFSPTGSAVQISFDSASGPTLWTGMPGADGTFGFSFTVPNAPPGSYSIVATQSQNGGPVPGTPAHATLVVTAVADPPTAGPLLVPTQPAPPAAPTDPPQPATPAQTDPPVASPDPTPAPADPTAAPAPTLSPAHAGSRPRPPQVASLWRVGGADPSWMTGFAVSAVVTQETSPLVPLGAGVAIVVSVVATGVTLRRRTGDRPA